MLVQHARHDQGEPLGFPWGQLANAPLDLRAAGLGGPIVLGPRHRPLNRGDEILGVDRHKDGRRGCRQRALSGATGRVKRKLAPPCGLFSASTAPPCALTMVRTMARPIPSPALLVV